MQKESRVWLLFRHTRETIAGGLLKKSCVSLFLSFPLTSFYSKEKPSEQHTLNTHTQRKEKKRGKKKKMFFPVTLALKQKGVKMKSRLVMQVLDLK